eukprot:TRINITY_DN6137_c0_g1_i1.p1 TRINITY_DN6137_c0_g1~~TRINITY_DN6137_c0_g1_i1.p1  ORF type:complete len:124 (+),score=29.79 TRINITY_DN6137_c0_g1_i1:171-542(+)
MDGSHVAFVGHGSTLHVAKLNSEDAKDSECQTLHSRYLPSLTCDFLQDDIIVTCGFDMNPHMYENKNDEWVFVKKLDPEKEEEKNRGSDIASTRNTWKNMDKHGTKRKRMLKLKLFTKILLWM